MCNYLQPTLACLLTQLRHHPYDVTLIACNQNHVIREAEICKQVLEIISAVARVMPRSLSVDGVTFVV